MTAQLIPGVPQYKRLHHPLLKHATQMPQTPPTTDMHAHPDAYDALVVYNGDSLHSWGASVKLLDRRVSDMMP